MGINSLSERGILVGPLAALVRFPGDFSFPIHMRKPTKID